MLTIMKLWPYILGAAASVAASYALGYFIGLSDGKAHEKEKVAQVAIVEAKKGQSLKEKNQNETRSLSNADVDAGLAALGLLRSGD